MAKGKTLTALIAEPQIVDPKGKFKTVRINCETPDVFYARLEKVIGSAPWPFPIIKEQGYPFMMFTGAESCIFHLPNGEIMEPPSWPKDIFSSMLNDFFRRNSIATYFAEDFGIFYDRAVFLRWDMPDGGPGDLLKNEVFTQLRSLSKKDIDFFKKTRKSLNHSAEEATV